MRTRNVIAFALSFILIVSFSGCAVLENGVSTTAGFDSEPVSSVTISDITSAPVTEENPDTSRERTSSALTEPVTLPDTDVAVTTEPPQTDPAVTTAPDVPDINGSPVSEGSAVFFISDYKKDGINVSSGDAAILLKKDGGNCLIAVCGKQIEISSSMLTLSKSAEALELEKKYGGIYYPGPGHLVLIDPGHQAKQMSELEPIGPGSSEQKAKVSSGTSGVVTRIKEYELNLAVSLYLRNELIARGYGVIMTRETNDVSLSNIDRAMIGNNYGAEINVKVHANGISSDSSVHGALTVCPGKDNEYIGYMYDECLELAESVLDELCKSTGFRKMSILKSDTMTGFNWAKQPTTYVELGFMSNPDEDKRMAEDSYRRTAAEGIANGIDRYFGSSDPSDDALVRITDYIPDIFVDLRYSGTDNFTGQVIYDFDDPLLRFGTVSKLMSVQRELNEYGFSLLVWDAFRPVSAQYRLWEVCPDPVYVADPEKGHSNHCRGNTVDVTLVTLTGEGVEMPSDFDNFSALADRDYGDVSEEAKENALLLESIMTANGFKGYYSEWWHFTDTVSYPVVEG